jgi:hypothetical protein
MLSLSSLKRKPCLFDFIYASCPGPCLLLTARMVRIARKLGPALGRRVCLVSVTGDPERDKARDQYNGGYIPYLTLLSAENFCQQTLLILIEAEATRYADTAALFQALGSGWWNRSDVKPLDSPLTIPQETDK